MSKRIQALFLVSVFLLSCFVGAFYDLKLGEATASDDWPMLQHDTTHSGLSSSTAPNTNATLWNCTSTSAYAYLSPAIVNGNLYIASISEEIYCMNALTGNLEWVYQANSSFPESGTPAVVNGEVIIGIGSVVYCLNASTGTLIWSYQTGGA